MTIHMLRTRVFLAALTFFVGVGLGAFVSHSGRPYFIVSLIGSRLSGGAL
jgi:hypothetical protein